MGYFGHGPINHERFLKSHSLKGRFDEMVGSLSLRRAISLWHPHHAKSVDFAYIGPGAGFAFSRLLSHTVGRFLPQRRLDFVVARSAWSGGLIRGALRDTSTPRVKKLIFLGLDGLDPTLTEKFMAAGKLPNLKKLQETGRISPAADHVSSRALFRLAWSTFATGVNPARHSMFDFLNRNLELVPPGTLSTRVLQSEADAEDRQVPHSVEQANRGDCGAKSKTF